MSRLIAIFSVVLCVSYSRYDSLVICNRNSFRAAPRLSVLRKDAYLDAFPVVGNLNIEMT